MLLNKKGRDGDLDCEEETRSLLLLQLQSYGRDSVDEMDLIQQVLERDNAELVEKILRRGEKKECMDLEKIKWK